MTGMRSNTAAIHPRKSTEDDGKSVAKLLIVQSVNVDVVDSTLISTNKALDRTSLIGSAAVSVKETVMQDNSHAADQTIAVTRSNGNKLAIRCDFLRLKDKRGSKAPAVTS